VKPELWVFGGPNGAGKSTLVDRYLGDRLPVVNPDNIARDLPRKPDGSLAQGDAGRIATQQRAEYLDGRASFAIESTLSGKGELRLMREAKDAGYSVNLVYVGIPSAQLSTARVQERVRQGGHDVPIADSDRRYPRSMANLEEAMRIADRSMVIDNSGDRHRIVLLRENDRTRYLSGDLPRWAESAIPAELRRDPSLNRTEQPQIRPVEPIVSNTLPDRPASPSRTLQQAPSASDRVPDRAERLVIMNGSRLHERHLEGRWTVMDAEPQGMNPKGVYRLDTARDADTKTKGEYRGTVLHIDKANVYQLGSDSQVVRHDRERFKEAPNVGEGARIGYDNGRAVMLNRSPEPSPNRGNPTPPAPTRSTPDRER
jgi:predicted ABC-type ATPase